MYMMSSMVHFFSQTFSRNLKEDSSDYTLSEVSLPSTLLVLLSTVLWSGAPEKQTVISLTFI